MNHTEFAALIKNSAPSGAYLFHGGEEFVKDGMLRTLLNSLDEGTRALNAVFFEEADYNAVRAACETLPFFAERRVVVCRALPVEDAARRFADYAPLIPPSTALIFFTRGKAADNLTIVKALKAMGREVLFIELTADEAARWLLQRGKKLGSPIAEKDARYLINLVGTDMTALSGEFEKAAAYAGEGREVTRAVLDAVVTPSLESDTFRIINLLSDGRKQEGFLALKRLLDSGASAMGLATLFGKRIQTVLKARQLIDEGLKRAEASKALALPPAAAQRNYDFAKRFSYAEVAEIAKAFSDVGFLNNSGAMKDTQALEAAFFKYFVR
ncbi:MAG: DNA polymerase III subunit delta [Eubacteriales bacterium]|nr:DNA polymerase III subunit delta [Eubacteriales bacterium]